MLNNNCRSSFNRKQTQTLHPQGDPRYMKNKYGSCHSLTTQNGLHAVNALCDFSLWIWNGICILTFFSRCYLAKITLLFQQNVSVEMNSNSNSSPFFKTIWTTMPNALFFLCQELVLHNAFSGRNNDSQVACFSFYKIQFYYVILVNTAEYSKWTKLIAGEIKVTTDWAKRKTLNRNPSFYDKM